jgi:hypothetical protein
MSRDRDELAQERDDRAEACEGAHDEADAGSRSDRAAAKRDRQAAASDRTHALHDRVAGADRVLSSRERSEFLIEDLTGAHRRSAALLELEREITRAQRTGTTFSPLASLTSTASRASTTLWTMRPGTSYWCGSSRLRSRIRPYDLVVRIGGDEFLCGLLDMDLAEAERRVELVNPDLKVGLTGHVTAGLARLETEDSLADLIRPADEDLYRRRRRRGVPTSGLTRERRRLRVVHPGTSGVLQPAPSRRLICQLPAASPQIVSTIRPATT